MPRMIAVKIKTGSIDKSKLYQGKNGTYLDVLLIETENDKYGNDFMVVQSVSKEERAAGVKGAILGNAKWIGGAGSPAKPAGKIDPADVPPRDREVPF